jgi:hypothetical protein
LHYAQIGSGIVASSGDRVELLRRGLGAIATNGVWQAASRGKLRRSATHVYGRQIERTDV